MSKLADIVKAEIKGVVQLKANLEQFRLKITRSGMRVALTKATTPTVRKVKQATPVRTGRLKKYMRRKIWTDVKTSTVGATIGPKSGSETVASPDGKAIKVTPAKYFHLVEFGHGGPHPAPPHPFMRPTWTADKPDCEKRFADNLRPEITKAAARLAKRRPTK